jgi:hypothetical protein
LRIFPAHRFSLKISAAPFAFRYSAPLFADTWLSQRNCEIFKGFASSASEMGP